MEPDREDLRTARPRAGRPGPAVLLDAWRRHSLANGWLVPDDWHTEAVNTVVTAVNGTAINHTVTHDAPVDDTVVDDTAVDETGALTVACARLGRSRAKAGIGIAETIEDLAALFAVLGDARGSYEPERFGGEPPLHLVCSLAEGWVEGGLPPLAPSVCEDPLSGLATLPYLRTRLAELYREAAQLGTSPAQTHRLLVISLRRRPDAWHRMAAAILLGHDLRAAFPGGETLTLARPGLALALVGAADDLPLRYARLRRMIQGALGAQIQMTRLPRGLAEALRLVEEALPDDGPVGESPH